MNLNGGTAPGESAPTGATTQPRMSQGGAPGQQQGEGAPLCPIRINGNRYLPLFKVFVQRDYRLGTAIRYHNEFPPELAGRIDPNAFEYTMHEINEIFEDAEKFSCWTFWESCFGCLSFSLYWLCKDSRYERALKRITKFIAEQNQRVYLPNLLYITDPVVRGLRVIEMTVLAEPRS